MASPTEYPALVYHGSDPLDPEPVHGPTLREVGHRLVHNADVVGVNVQPGDGTMYHFIVALCGSPRIHAAALGCGDDYILFSMVNGMTYPLAKWCDPGYIHEHINPHNGNVWSATLIHWWLECLWVEIDKARKEEY